MSAALRGTIVTPLTEGGTLFLEDGLVEIGTGGRVTSVGPTPRRAPSGVVDLRPHVLVPGFVDAHTHFPQTNIIGEATGALLDWLEASVFPEEARFADLSHARRTAKRFVSRMISAGTTAAAVFSSAHPTATEVLLRAMKRRRLRGAAGLTLMNQNCPKALRLGVRPAMAAVDRLSAQFTASSRVAHCITPRFAISCTRALLKQAGRAAARHGQLVQTHISENEDEGRLTLSVHPYAKDYLNVYELAGLVGPRTIVAHGIHLSPSERRRLGRAGASVAHCPDSNFFLGSGRMSRRRLLEAGVNVALGSDVAAGRSFSMRRAMSSAYDNALAIKESIEPDALLRMATLDGARALGLEHRCGTLEPGRAADVVAFLPERAMTGLAEALAFLVFDTDRTDAGFVFVDGKSQL